MKAGWIELARLGVQGCRYPHVLVDAHGWCIRWGPKYHQDEKYYSTLPSLLRGLAEHGVRRGLAEEESAARLGQFIDRIKQHLARAEAQAQSFLESLGVELQPILQEWRKRQSDIPDASRPLLGEVIGFRARSKQANR